MPTIQKAFTVTIVIASILLIFCNTKSDAGESDQYAATFISKLNPTDSFLLDLPKNDTSILALKRKNDSLLKLPSLESGFDSIQLRFSFGCALGPRFLVILKNSTHIWTAEISEQKYHVNSSGDNHSLHECTDILYCSVYGVV